jgi:cytochrome c
MQSRLRSRSGVTNAVEEGEMMSGIRIAVLLVVFLAGTRAAMASKQDDQEMNALAKASGCYLCHRIEPRKPGGQETLPPGPPWKEVARKYRNQPNSTERLTRTVLQGSGSYPGDRHWKGKAREAQMPANALEISEADARKLVSWILALDK